MSKDPNPGWTRAPWSIGNGASASQLMPPPPPRPPLNPQPPTASTSGSTDGLDLSASRWEDYFAEKLSCPVRGGSFRVYLSERAAPDAPLVVCLHGAGYTGLSWALVAAELRGFCTLAALDLRGHGETTIPDEGDLSADTLTADVLAVVAHLQSLLSPVPSGPTQPLVLVGHSMGGAVAVRAASPAASPPLANLRGLIVVDIVEGTALESLPKALEEVSRRPASFPTLRAAMAWALRAGLTSSVAALRVGLPSQLRPGSSAAAGGGGADGGATAAPAAATEEGGGASSSAAAPPPPLVWRTRVADSAKYWDGWYRGLSSLFLQCRCPRLLVCAGTDRLDRDLTLAQMQGKFQFLPLPTATHAVHEDAPREFAAATRAFLGRYATGAAAAAAAAAAGVGLGAGVGVPAGGAGGLGAGAGAARVPSSLVFVPASPAAAAAASGGSGGAAAGEHDGEGGGGGAQNP